MQLNLYLLNYQHTEKWSLNGFRDPLDDTLTSSLDDLEYKYNNNNNKNLHKYHT